MDATRPHEEALDSILAQSTLSQSSLTELYAYELARGRSKADHDADGETQVLDHVLGKYEEWS